jgi:hypothetical protein
LTVSKRIITSGIIALFGFWAILGAMEVDIGSAGRMGAGYFPLALGLILAAMAFANLFVADPDAETGLGAKIKLRQFAGIVVGMLIFIFAAPTIGYLPAIFALVLVSALADEENGLLLSVVLGLICALVALAVFTQVLNVPLSPIGGR